MTTTQQEKIQTKIEQLRNEIERVYHAIVARGLGVSRYDLDAVRCSSDGYIVAAHAYRILRAAPRDLRSTDAMRYTDQLMLSLDRYSGADDLF